MYERNKVLEAECFLTEMAKMSDNFHYHLSAFLSAARSALQYALVEARTKGQQRWYDNAMNSSEVLCFFKDKRNINVHVRPLALMQQVTLTETVHLEISESLVVKVEGTTKVRQITNTPPISSQRSSSNSEGQYLFDDWPGKEDVLTLSRKYLAELKSFVESGVSLGHISG